VANREPEPLARDPLYYVARNVLLASIVLDVRLGDPLLEEMGQRSHPEGVGWQASAGTSGRQSSGRASHMASLAEITSDRRSSCCSKRFTPRKGYSNCTR
jgi:hypothetical protein